MINYTLYQQQVSDYLINYTSESLDQSASDFTDFYINMIQTGTLLLGNTILTFNKSSIEDAYKLFFNTQFNSPIDLGLVPYLPLANGFIDFWKSVKFNPVPPHPPTSSPTVIPPDTDAGVNIKFFGDPISLANNLYNAYTSGYVEDETQIEVLVNTVVTNLITSFTTLHSSILGIYNGIITGPPPSSASIPWISVI